MRAPLSWLREHVALPADQTPRDIAHALVRVGFEVESVDVLGADITGPLVVGVVREFTVLEGFKKPIRHCMVDVGTHHGGVRSIICGASNFVVGDTVVVALPGAVLPGGFAIASRETYGRLSDGMICSERELGLSDDHAGIMVLPADAGVPGDDAMAVLGLPDAVLDVSVTPDRGYAMSIRGLARELAIAYDLPFEDPGLRLPDLPEPAGSSVVTGRIADGTPCSLLVLRTLRGFDPSSATPIWMRQRLSLCGMRSISLAVDVTNYVMLELGQPLHAFDANAVRGDIVVRLARDGERLETLDHVQRHLHADDLLITDDRGPISLAGTMGGLDTEIGDASTDLVIEAAHFDAATIARMGRRHRLGSEASRRFERGVDPMLAPFASARAIELLLAHGGGTYVGATGQESGHAAVRITMNSQHPAQIAGTAIASDEVVRSLMAVGAEVHADGDSLVVIPPSWRPDLTQPADLVEEVVRLHGYERLPSVVPQAPAQHGLTEAQRMRRRIGVALAGAGYTETLQYPFVGDADLDALLIPCDDERRLGVRLANPLRDEQPLMRTTLLPGLLQTALRNIARGETNLALMEMGAVHVRREGQADVLGTEPVRPSTAGRPTQDQVHALEALLPQERLHIAAVLTGERERAGWWGDGRAAGWMDAVTMARIVADTLAVDVQVRHGDRAPWHPGRCAELVLVTAHGEWVVGHAGELHPRVIESLGLPARACAVEMHLDPLIEATVTAVSTSPLSTFPVAKEDVALIVDAGVSAEQVAQALREGGGDLLESVRLFDVYTGPQVGEGKRSLAFALRWRASDRTLTDGDIAVAREAAVAAAVAACGAILRGA